jgi:2-polyprenyl-3-methyl-5-hydroxy-6-metoxy-1,4-benzoquinol methylase
VDPERRHVRDRAAARGGVGVTHEFDYWMHSRGAVRRGILGRASWAVRRSLYATFANEIRPTAAMRVLDVGASGDLSLAESNSFEKLYPFPDRLTVLGIDNLSALRETMPRTALVQGDALRLPFPAGAFDVAVAEAVIEHIGDRANQRLFVSELTRVARRCFITTPNRWFPMELHTFLPVLHYLPPATYHRALKRISPGTWVNQDTVNLLSARQLQALFPPDRAVKVTHGPLGANLIAIV